MWFVVGPSKISRSKLPYVVLEKDNWDDYGYKTTFKATFWRSANDSVDLGSIKILKLGQIGGYPPMPEKPFEALGPDYCSVGVDLGYYEKLFKLGASVYRPYLEGIADVAYSDEIRAKFEGPRGLQGVASKDQRGGADNHGCSSVIRECDPHDEEEGERLRRPLQDERR